MSEEQNKTVVRRLVEEFWNEGNLAAVDELMAPDVTIQLPSGERVSREGLKAFATAFRAAFPDWHATIEEMVAQDEQVAERWTGRGTHRGAFQGIAPTDKTVTVPGSVFYRFAAGKIVEFRGQFDRMGMMQQIGVIPVPAQAGG